MYKPLGPFYDSEILNYVFKQKLSKEEAALLILVKHFDEIKAEMVNQRKFIDAYETFDTAIYSMIKRGENEIRIKKAFIHPPRDKKKYDLFLRFYRAAKRDLRTKRKISSRTWKLINNTAIAQKPQELQAFTFATTCLNMLRYEGLPEFKRFKQQLIDLVRGTQYDIPEIVEDLKQIAPRKTRPLWLYPPLLLDMARFIAADLSIPKAERERHIKGFEDFQHTNLDYIFNYRGPFNSFQGPAKDREPAYMLKFCAFLSVWFKQMGKLNVSKKIDLVIKFFENENKKYELIKELLDYMIIGIKPLYKGH